ncbi:MAG: AraC family transcriptional regulator [Erysipelotrichaceae bacterium]|nr:AraC family transcriptional regulator [Erysipelotrichaceae bacterium]
MMLNYARYEIQVPKGNVHYPEEGLRIFAKKETMEPEDNFHSLQHIHEDFECMYILDGYLYYTIDGETIKAGKGDVVFINSNEMHASQLKESNGCQFEIILIHPSVYASVPMVVNDYLNPVLQADTAFRVYSAGTREAYALSSIIHHMSEQLKEQNDGYELNLLSDAFLFLKNIWKSFDHAVSSDPVSQDMTLLNRMTACIYHHYSEKLTLSDIASSANVSISTANRIFRHFLNSTPVDFLNQCRLESAAGLLRATDKPISDIAYDCGFSQQSYFTRIFRREYGCTPASYRKQPNDIYVH